MGFDAQLVTRSFELTSQIEELKQVISAVRIELLGVDTDLDTIEGLLTLRSQEENALATHICGFDFCLIDSSVNRELVDELDGQIADLNQQRYYLSVNRTKIVRSLEKQIVAFDPEEAKHLFEEASQTFPDQICKTFDDLIRFNHAIAEERKGYLAAEKYRTLNERLVDLCAEIERLKDQRQAFLHLRERKREQVQLQEQWNQIQQSIEDNIEAEASAQQSRYRAIRGYLNEFTRQVLDRGVLLRTYLNQEGNIEFAAEYLGTDGKPSGEDQGKTYRQLLCAAFDLAVARAMLDEPYIRFLYHDGLLEGLDDRKKLKLITTIRRFAVFGIQQIVTFIDSDLPTDETGNRIAFQNDEIVLTLHDEDDIGRLFRMPPW